MVYADFAKFILWRICETSCQHYAEGAEDVHLPSHHALRVRWIWRQSGSSQHQGRKPISDVANGHDLPETGSIAQGNTYVWLADCILPMNNQYAMNAVGAKGLGSNMCWALSKRIKHNHVEMAWATSREIFIYIYIYTSQSNIWFSIRTARTLHSFYRLPCL